MDNVHLPADQAFYTELMNELDREDVKPQIYHLLHETGKLVETPIEFQVYLRERQNQVLFQNLFVKRTTEDILRSFDEVGIHAIWLKGTRFAERFFGHYGARATSDVDILIPRAHAELAQMVLRGLGYHGHPHQVPNHYHQQFVKQTNDRNHLMIVELHYDLIKPGNADLDLEPLKTHAQLLRGYQCVAELSDQHTFYAMCIHAVNHAMNHLKHRLDIIHLLCRHNSSVDLKQLVHQAEHDETLRLVGMALSSVYEEFPFLHNVQTLPKPFRIFWTRKQIRLYLIFNLVTLDGWRRKLRCLTRWFLPTKTVAEDLVGIQVPKQTSLVWVYAMLYALRWKQFWTTRPRRNRRPIAPTSNVGGNVIKERLRNNDPEAVRPHWRS